MKSYVKDELKRLDRLLMDLRGKVSPNTAGWEVLDQAGALCDSLLNEEKLSIWADFYINLRKENEYAR